MKDFDAFRADKLARDDRAFKIGGETFVCRASVRPEVFIQMDALQDATNADSIRIIDAFIADCIEHDDDALARWKKVREQDDNAIGLGDLLKLSEWIVEMTADRSPTQPPSPSADGPERTGMQLTAV